MIKKGAAKVRCAGGGAHSVPLCVVLSLKRQVRAAPPTPSSFKDLLNYVLDHCECDSLEFITCDLNIYLLKLSLSDNTFYCKYGPRF
jgi:hypothetical protein